MAQAETHPNEGRSGRGGAQRILRPEGFSVVAGSPWAHLTPEQRRLSVADVRAALAQVPSARPVSAHPFHPVAVAEAERLGLSFRDAAVLLVLFEEDGEARLVLTRRPDHLPTHQGDVAFPGGKRDPALDVDVQATALREAHEEIGLDPQLVDVLAELDHVPSIAGAFAMAPFVGIVDGRPALSPAAGEVDRVFDVALSELLDPEVHHLERWNRFGIERTAYIFELDGDTMWGATALITAVFLGLVTGVEVTVS